MLKRYQDRAPRFAKEWPKEISHGASKADQSKHGHDKLSTPLVFSYLIEPGNFCVTTGTTLSR